MLGLVYYTKVQVDEVNIDHQPPTAELPTKLEQDAQLWNNLPCTSGSAIERSKCTYHVFEWIFCKGYLQLGGGKSITNLNL